MSLAVDKVCATIDVEAAWIEKLDGEKCDLDKVISRLKRDLRIIKRNYVECAYGSNDFFTGITELEESIKDICELKIFTNVYRRMLLRLFEQIKSFFLRNYKYSSFVFCYTNESDKILKKAKDIRCLSDRKLNMFFPNVDSVYMFSSNIKDNFNTYASSKDDHVYSNLKNIVDYRILGELRGGSLISNNFDALYMRPEFQYRIDMNKDSEKVSILSGLKYIRNGGVFMLEIPYSRLSDDLLLLLSKKIVNIQFAKVGDSYNTIFITGTKVEAKSAEDSAEDYDLLINLMNRNYYRYDFQDTIDFSMYSVPSDEAEISLFRGSRVSKEEMCDYCKESGLIDSFLKEEKEIKADDTHPLLPFNIGQVGLVLTSSQLNGIVRDEKGIPHLIKGMTVKDTNTSEEVDGDQIRSTEIVANRVQINIMSADGRIIKIS